MAGEVLNMSDLTINKHRCKLKVLCFKNRHKTIYLTLCATGLQILILSLDNEINTYQIFFFDLKNY